VRDLSSFLIDTFVTGMGRLLLREMNEYDPPEILALVIGLAFWALLIFLVWAVMLGGRARRYSSSENSEKIARVRRQPRGLARFAGSPAACLTKTGLLSLPRWGGGQCARCVPVVSLAWAYIDDRPLRPDELFMTLLPGRESLVKLIDNKLIRAV
jgi:hypothetical protein